VPHTAPTRVGGGGPAWSGFCVTLPWEMYRHHGRSTHLRRAFPLFNAGWPSLKPNPSKTCLCVMVALGISSDWQWPKFWEDRRAVEKEKKFLGDTREVFSSTTATGFTT